MIHERHFTVAEANALLERVEPMLRSLRGARSRITDAEAHEALAGAAPGNGGGDPGRNVGEADAELLRSRIEAAAGAARAAVGETA